MKAKYIFWLILTLMLLQTVCFFYFQVSTPLDLHFEALPTVRVHADVRTKPDPQLEVFHKPDPQLLVQSAPIIDPQQILVPSAKDERPVPPVRQPQAAPQEAKP